MYTFVSAHYNNRYILIIILFLLIDKSKVCKGFFYGASQTLSQKLRIPHLWVGMISIVESLLNAKKVAIKILCNKAHSKVKF